LAIDDIAARLATDRATTVLIDGRSGSGKSTLATQLHTAWPDSLVVRLDDIYPGWDGLLWAAEHLQRELLAPRAEGRPGRWRGWDWTRDAPAGWHTVGPQERLVVEGIGALTPASRALADLGIWVHAEDDDRKRRALSRDGDLYRPHWNRWAAQELAFIERHRPQACADLIAVPTGLGFGFTTPEGLP
jgi:uridine kinase